MSAATIRSATGALMSTIGKKRDGTYTVRTYLVGDGDEYPDMEIWFQDGFLDRGQASSWAEADMSKREKENGWTVEVAA